MAPALHVTDVGIAPQGVRDVSSTWGLPGRTPGKTCAEGEVKRMAREISLAGCFLVHNDLRNMI